MSRSNEVAESISYLPEPNKTGQAGFVPNIIYASAMLQEM